MRLTTLLVLAMLCAPAFTAPPYDVTATVSAPSVGGPVAGYVLVLDGVDVGPVSIGPNVFPGLLTADGTYVFAVRATNSAGSMLSDPVTVTTATVQPPGQPGVSIQVACNPSPCPANIVITISP